MINVVVLQGRFTRDPELYTDAKTAQGICHFTLASAKRKDDTIFVNCTAFGKQAESIVEYCRKGDMVVVQGSLNVHRWQNRSGENKESYEVNVNSCEFVNGSVRERVEDPNPLSPPTSDITAADITGEDTQLPF